MSKGEARAVPDASMKQESAISFHVRRATCLVIYSLWTVRVQYTDYRPVEVRTKHVLRALAARPGLYSIPRTTYPSVRYT